MLYTIIKSFIKQNGFGSTYLFFDQSLSDFQFNAHIEMPRTVTTVSVHPDRADKLREIRDEEGLPNLDAALGEILNQRGE